MERTSEQEPPLAELLAAGWTIEEELRLLAVVILVGRDRGGRLEHKTVGPRGQTVEDVIGDGADQTCPVFGSIVGIDDMFAVLAERIATREQEAPQDRTVSPTDGDQAKVTTTMPKAGYAVTGGMGPSRRYPQCGQVDARAIRLFQNCI